MAPRRFFQLANAGSTMAEAVALSVWYAGVKATGDPDFLQENLVEFLKRKSMPPPATLPVAIAFGPLPHLCSR